VAPARLYLGIAGGMGAVKSVYCAVMDAEPDCSATPFVARWVVVPSRGIWPL